MIVYTDQGLARLSLSFDLSKVDSAWVTIRELQDARDYAQAEADRHADLADELGHRLDVKPFYCRMCGVQEYINSRDAFRRWSEGKASKKDLYSAMKYCTHQVQLWEDECAILDSVISARLRATQEQSAIGT